MAEETLPTQESSRFNPWTLLWLLLPLVLLGAVIYLFLQSGGGLQIYTRAPIEALNFERTELSPGEITLHVRNSGPEEMTIAQVIVNAAVWPFESAPSATLPRLGTAQIKLAYPWVLDEAYAITLFTTNAIAFETEIPIAFSTPTPDARTFWSFTLIGVYVGVIPVYLGMLWLPALRKLSRRWMTFLLAVTAGLLIFLGMDTLVEAIEQSVQVPNPLQWTGLITIGAVGTFALLYALSNQQSRLGRSDADRRMRLAFMIALGIGIHNLGEGLAIGAAYNVGEIALGAFLVVGFIIQNITEGLGIIAPVARDRPSLGQLVLMGALGGAPAIVGAWIGAFTPSPTLAVLFLAIGTGAIFEVAYEILKIIAADPARQARQMLVFSGLLTGMLLLWVTGLMIK